MDGPTFFDVPSNYLAKVFEKKQVTCTTESIGTVSGGNEREFKGSTNSSDGLE